MVEELPVGVAFGDAAFLGGEFEGFLAVEFGLVHEFIDPGGERLGGIGVGAEGGFFGWADHEGDFTFCGMLLESLEEFGKPAAAEFLVELGDFAG